MTSPCSPELLESALTGDLPPDREETLHRHLDECESCAAALTKLSGGEAWRQEVANMLAADEYDEALQDSRSGGNEWSSVDFTVEYLDPGAPAQRVGEPNVLGRLGGYDVLEIIGRGGMGVVLKAFDPELKRCVAIKVLSPHLAQSSLARKRFAREAQAAAAVVHPNVMAIHQVQPNGRLPFLVMPLVAGESLAQRLAAQGRLELKETLRIGMQAAAALAAAHEQGLVHRDVKPANILLEKGVERALLTDFGLARAADDVSMTRWGIIAGTPQYMSPEQANGGPLDGRSDLFSLGCVLYEMATGVSPFQSDSTMATLRRLIDDAPPAMAALNPELPPWFIGLVERLLEKDPSRRFASAKEVSELLEGCLAHLQQPASASLPAALSPLPPGEGQGVRVVERSFQSCRPEQACAVPAQIGLFARVCRKFASLFRPTGSRKPLILGTLAMLSLLGISLIAVGVVGTPPPDISGQWSGADWGQVVLAQTAPGQYAGTYTDAVVKGPGKIDLKWSRIERRFNGTWSEGDARFGELSLHPVDEEIWGALTTDRKCKINPATPHLAEVRWTRGGPLTSGAESKVDPNVAAAERFVDLLSRGKFDEATSYFDDTVERLMPPAKLKELWDGLAAAGGVFQGRGKARTEKFLIYEFVYVPGNWDRNKIDFKIVFDKQGKISGLWIVAPATVAVPAAPKAAVSPDSATAMREFYFVTYPVGDLVVKVPAVVDVPAQSGGTAASGQPQPAKADFDWLNALIFAKVAPDSWLHKGGKGTVSHNEANLTITVCHTQEAHKEITKLLEGLRRQQDVQIVLKARFIELDVNYAKRLDLNDELAAYDARRAADLLKRVSDDRRTNVWQAPMVTLFDGQAARYPNPYRGNSPEHLRVQTATVNDRTMVKLRLITDQHSKDIALTVRVKDGETAVADLSFPNDRANNGKSSPDRKVVIMMITPQIQVQEEEEDKIDMPGPRADRVEVYRARYNAAKAKAEDDIDIRYAIAAAKLAKADYEFNKKANADVPGSVPQAKLEELLMKCNEVDLAVEKAKNRQRADVKRAEIAKAVLDAAQAKGAAHDAKAVVSDFLDALRRGDDAKAKSLLTAVARKKSEQGRAVAPSANKSVKIEVDDATFPTPGHDIAHVPTRWIDKDESGKPQIDRATWVCRLESDGWRVAGFAAYIFQGEDPIFMNFEDPEDMARQQKWLHEEIERRAKQESGAPSSGKNPVPADGSFKERPAPAKTGGAAAARPAGKPKVSADQIAVEDLALQMIVAIREKDDKKLKSFASDRIKGWPAALPVFAVELRERYRQNMGNEKFDLRAGESLVEGDLAAVRCTGPKELKGKCLVLFFVKSGGRWLNYTLRASMENVPLSEHLAKIKKQP